MKDRLLPWKPKLHVDRFCVQPPVVSVTPHSLGTETLTSASGRRYKRLIFAGTLTKNQIDQLAQFFTWSLRSTVYTSVQEMRETIMASYYHHSASDFQPMHYYCPQGENLWCWYNKAWALGNRPKTHARKDLFFS